MFVYPDFFSVGVASAGQHDPRYASAEWGARYYGIEQGTVVDGWDNASLAKNLKGKLLLIHGEMDEEVPPMHTLKVVEALIASNKDFDLLLVPNTGHSVIAMPYVKRRRMEYFADHLIRQPNR